MRRILPLGAILTVLFLGLTAGCDSGQTPFTPATGLTSQSDVTAYRNSLQVGDWTLSMVGFKRYEFIPAGKGSTTELKPANGIFGATLLNVVNRGSAPTKLDLTQFELVDSAGNVFKASDQATRQYSGGKEVIFTVDEPIPAGETRQVGILYDLPATTYIYTLRAMGGKMDPGPLPER